MTIKDIIAARFMRAASLQTVIESAVDYCANMGRFDGWGVTFNAHSYNRYGEDKSLYDVTVKKIENVDKVSDIRADMSAKESKVDIYCHYVNDSLDFVAVFYARRADVAHHQRSLAFGLVTRDAYERVYSDYADFPDELDEIEFGEFANFGNWYAIDSGNGYIVARVAMITALMIEFDINVDSALDMIRIERPF